jgi:hypothetical protein
MLVMIVKGKGTSVRDVLKITKLQTQQGSVLVMRGIKRTVRVIVLSVRNIALIVSQQLNAELVQINSTRTVENALRVIMTYALCVPEKINAIHARSQTLTQIKTVNVCLDSSTRTLTAFPAVFSDARRVNPPVLAIPVDQTQHSTQS